MINRRVFIVDDDPAVCDALLTLVQSVGLHGKCFGSAEAFLDARFHDQVDCLVTDICLPGTDGITLQRILIERGIDIPIIAMSAHGDIAMAVEMVRRGAIDFIEKPFRNHAMLQRINEALSVAERLYEHRIARTDIETCLQKLTPREAEILQELIEGDSNKVIARRLDLSPRTVETHRANILRKMHADSVTALAVRIQAYRSQKNSQ